MRSCYTFILLLLLSVTAMAQTTIFDFEGADPTFIDFNGSVTTVIDNPDATEPNLSAKVAQNVVPPGVEFSGVKIANAINFADGKVFTLHVWSPQANLPVLLKFEGGTDPATIERGATFTGAANSWQELTFSFEEEVDLSFVDVVLFMNFNVVGGQELTFYWDNLVQGGGAPIDAFPMTAAPTPTAPAAEVVSIFSDAYTDVMVDTYRTDWSVGDLLDTMIEGNATMKYSNLDFVGIETTTSTVDLATAGATVLHLDYWSANGTAFAVKLVDFGADDAFGGGDDVEHQLDVTGLTQGEWNSIDLQLNDFAGLTTRSNIAQYVLVGMPTGANNIYIDNIYFYIGAPVLGQIDLPVTFDDATVDYGLAGFGGSTGMKVVDPTDATNMVGQVIKGAGAALWAGVTMTSVTDGAPVGFANAIPFATGATVITARVWSPAAGVNVRLKAEKNDDPTISVETDANTLTTVAGGWEMLTFDFSTQADGTAAINFASVYDKLSIFMDFGNDMPATEATYYFDDVIFTGGGGNGGPTSPLTAAPTPTAPAAEVVSIFSDAYDDEMVDTYRTDWSVGDLLDTLIEGNATMKYSNLDFVGIETTTATVDLATAGVTAMHLDYWSGNGTAFAVKLVDFGADGAFGGGDDSEHQLDVTGLTQGEWNAIDLQLSDFVGLTTRSNLAQYILVGQPTGTHNIYIDNIYFYQGAPATGQMDLPVTFDEEGVDYGLAGFGNSNGALVADPEDATNMVGQVIKSANAETWAGVTMTSTSGGPDGFASRIPFAADATTITVRTWSPAAGINVLLKAEKTDDPTVSVETLGNTATTVAGGWETLTFDFSTEATGTAALDLNAVYAKLSIFFDFGNQPAAEATYYFDDVIFTDGGGGGDDVQMDLPVTFDEAGVDYGVADFGNNASMIVADPEDGSNTVVQSTKTAGAETWAGTTLTSSSGGPVGFASQVPFTADATKMSVSVWSPTSGTPVLLKVENKDDGAISVETLTNTTVAGGWEVLLFDFSVENPGTPALDLGAVYDKASIFFNFGTSPTADETYYWDDVYFGDIVGTNEPLIGLLEVFPNPIGNEFTVVAPERMESLMLFSSNGQKVGEWQPNAERFNLEAGHLAPGMYVALVRTSQGLMTIKLMKQ